MALGGFVLIQANSCTKEPHWSFWGTGCPLSSVPFAPPDFTPTPTPPLPYSVHSYPLLSKTQLHSTGGKQLRNSKDSANHLFVHNNFCSRQDILGHVELNIKQFVWMSNWFLLQFDCDIMLWNFTRPMFSNLHHDNNKNRITNTRFFTVFMCFIFLDFEGVNYNLLLAVGILGGGIFSC